MTLSFLKLKIIDKITLFVIIATLMQFLSAAILKEIDSNDSFIQEKSIYLINNISNLSYKASKANLLMQSLILCKKGDINDNDLCKMSKSHLEMYISNINDLEKENSSMYHEYTNLINKKMAIYPLYKTIIFILNILYFMFNLLAIFSVLEVKKQESPICSDSVEKKIKRGKESWDFFYMFFSVLLTLDIFIITVLPIGIWWRILIFLVLFLIIWWVCLESSWWQNKLIGLKIFLEERWKKI